MIKQFPSLNGAAAPKVSSFRVAGFIINESTFRTIAKEDHVEVLLDVLDRCVAPAEQRCHFGNVRAHSCSGDKDIPAALTTIEVTFPSHRRANASILGPLSNDNPALARSLKVLKIRFNVYDESAVLGTFASLAVQLQELTFDSCGLSSVQGLEGRCKHLTKLNLKVDHNGCKDLNSLEGMGDRLYLEEVDVSGTGISSIEPLRTCPNLTNVKLNNCRQLSSIDALADHKRLQKFSAYCTNIASIGPLRSCPKLTMVHLSYCENVSSIEALAGHQWLEEVYAAEISITSIDPLRSCPALTTVMIAGCERLPVNICLPASVKVLR